MCPGPFVRARLALAPAADNRRDRFQRRGLRPMAAYWPLDDRPGADAPVARPDRARLGAAERIRDAAARPGAVGGRADARRPGEIGRAHVCTPVTNAHLVCRLLLENKTFQH